MKKLWINLINLISAIQLHKTVEQLKWIIFVSVGGAYNAVKIYVIDQNLVLLFLSRHFAQERFSDVHRPRVSTNVIF